MMFIGMGVEELKGKSLEELESIVEQFKTKLKLTGSQKSEQQEGQ